MERKANFVRNFERNKKNIIANDENYLKRKRQAEDLSNNFIFRPILKGVIDNEYGENAHIYKNIFSFDWQDPKITKNKLNLCDELNSSAYWFYINSCYFPADLEKIKSTINNKKQIFSTIDDIIDYTSLSKPIPKKYTNYAYDNKHQIISDFASLATINSDSNRDITIPKSITIDDMINI